MKTLTISTMMLLFLFIFNHHASAQTIPQKANSIIITDTLTQSQYYDVITGILFEYGYGILNTDKDLGTITTTEKPFKNGGVKLIIMAKDNRVLLRGDFKVGMSLSMNGVTSEPSWSTIENRGVKNSAYQNAWAEMQKVADLIPGNKEYQIK